MLELLKPAILHPNSYSQARTKYLEYKHLIEVTKNHGQVRTYIELANVYKHLSLGHQVISVTKAMEVAGVKSDGLPVLAIANASAPWVWYVHDAGDIVDQNPGGGWRHGACAFISDYATNPGWNAKRRADKAVKGNVFRFIRFSIRPTSESNRARVPIIPPAILKKLPGNLDKYQILWEADWQSAPEDPMIIRRISRDMYVILGVWNLTEVERLVLDRAAFAAE